MKSNNSDWRGFTLQELRNEIVVNKVCRRVEQERIMMRVSNVAKNPLGTLLGRPMFKNIYKALSLTDYILLGFKIYKRIRKFSQDS